MIAAIAAGDPAGIAAAYDRYAAALYGYCHWMLRQPTATAEALQDTFVIAAITLGDLPEAPKLRPWLYAVARNECLRRLRTPPPADVEEADAPDQRAETAGQQAHVADQPADATLLMWAIREPVGVTRQIADATLPMRAVRQPIGVTRQLADATLPMRALRQAADADRPTSVSDGPAQADLPRSVRAILAELKPREREIIELNLRHDLYDADLATALDVSGSQAHALTARARGRLDKALGALLIARTRRNACPGLDKLLSDWDGQLTEEKRALVTRHIDKCGECARHKPGELRPTAISGLLPLAELPPELREPILLMCASATPDAVTYRRRAVRRAESIWSARFWPTIRRLSWRTIGSKPRSATIALAVWVVAVWVAGLTLLMVAGPHSSHTGAARPSTRAPLSSPAAAAVTTTAPTAAPTAASARPSRTAVPSPTYVAPLYAPSAPSHSPEPSKSVKPSKSPSPSSSHSGSPSPSPSRTTSPSASPSKTP